MWRSVLGKSGDKQDDSSRRKDGEPRSSQRKGSETGESPSATRKKSRGDDRDRNRGIDPSSTSYSTSSRSPYPGTSSASIASNYVTAQPFDQDDTVPRPDIVRNPSLIEKMPKSSKSGREDKVKDGDKDKTSTRRRDRSTSRERRRDGPRSEKRSSKSSEKHISRRNTDDGEYRGTMNGGSTEPRTIENGDLYNYEGTTRAGETDNFNSQIGGSGFSQFPGQYDSGMVGPPGHPPLAGNPVSSNVPDQFPGQFPDGATAPYRPPLSISEGGPGLAAEYYGDGGESVAHQPGVRPQQPTLIVGAQPHLMAASPIAAPPPEPSASGAVGAAASFFSGENFSTPSASPRPSQQRPRPLDSAQSAPVVHSNSFPGSAGPGGAGTLAGAAAGAAAAYMMGGSHSSGQIGAQTSSQQSFGPNDRPSQQFPPGGVPLPAGGMPSMPGMSTHSSTNNVPLAAAAGVAGAAGLAAAAYHNNHGSSPYPSPYGQYSSNGMVQQHRHRGPFSKLADFFRDPDGVAQFEEYSEYIGVCRYCFEPGSSPRQAPRRHNPRARRSSERLGSTTRVDKSRYGYVSSDGENKRRSKTGWMSAGIASYGLAQAGKAVFGNNRNFDDTYSVQSGRYNDSTASLQNLRRQSSKGKGRSSPSRKENESYGIDASIAEYRPSSKRKSSKPDRPRSRSRDRKSNGLAAAAVAAAVGTAVATSASRKRTPSPKGALVKTKRRSRSNSPDSALSGRRNSRRSRQSPPQETGFFGGFFTSPPPRRRSSQKKKKSKGGFFSFSNGSSSSTDSALALGKESKDRRSGRDSDSSRRRKSSPKIKSASDANAALLGLGVATAALVAAQGRGDGKTKRNGSLVAVKESKSKSDRRADHRDSSHQGMEPDGEDVWEYVDDASSVDSALAFGLPRRHSQESLSDSSGTNKWGWRWSSKKRESPSTKRNNWSAGVGGAAAGAAAGAALYSYEHGKPSGMDSNTSLPPLQHVHPVPTTDSYNYDAAQNGPGSVPGQPLMTSRPGPIPLQAPQPKPAVSSSVFTTQGQYEPSYSAPSGAPVFARDDAYDVRNSSSRYDTPDNKKRDVMAGRSNQMVIPEPTLITISPGPDGRITYRDEPSSVRFDFTKEQEEKQLQKDGRRAERREKKASGRVSDISKYGEQEDLEQRLHKSQTELQYAKGNRKSPEEEEIERRIEELKREGLWEEPARRPKADSGIDPTLVVGLAGMGLAGAAVGAAIAGRRDTEEPREETKEERRERRERRREERRREKDTAGYEKPKADEERSRAKKRSGSGSDLAGVVGIITGAAAANELSKVSEHREDIDARNYDASAQEQERKIAKRAAALVRRAPSPVHENYASYFLPEGILSKGDETSREAQDNDTTVYNIPEIIGGGELVFAGLEKFPEDQPVDTSLLTFPLYPPKLNLINPTPIPSRPTSAIGDRSQADEPAEAEVAESEHSSRSASKVTFGDNQTHEYEVGTPEDHREDIVASPRGNAIESRSRGTAKDDEMPIDEIQRDHVPGSFEEPLDFTATVAAGLEISDFDPAIVIDDESFRRRGSPPGTNDPDIYQQPSAETVQDLGLESRFGDRPHGFVEDQELPLTPADGISPSFTREGEEVVDRISKKDKKKREKASKRRSKDQDTTWSEEPTDSRESRELLNADDNDAELEIIEAASRAGSEEDEPNDLPNVTGNSSREIDELVQGDRSRSSRSKKEKSRKLDSQRAVSEKASNGSLSREASGIPLPEDEMEDLQSLKSQKSNSDAYESPNEYAAPAVSAPIGGDFEEFSSKKKKKKRRSTGNDEIATVHSSPAKMDDGPWTNGKAKEKKGGIFGLFSKSIDDASEKRREKEAVAEVEEEFEDSKKKKKKSRNSRDSEANKGKRDSKQDEDTGRTTRDLPDKADEDPPRRRSKREDDTEGQVSFLGERREITEPPDISDYEREYGRRGKAPLRATSRSSSSPPNSRHLSPARTSGAKDDSFLPETRSMSPKATPAARPRSLMQSGAVDSATYSPTAVPLLFRKPGFGGRATSIVGIPGSPLPSPPFARQRKERPQSREFRSNEFKPLWLVERHNAKQEVDSAEPYPPLPSSHTSSREPSEHGDLSDRASEGEARTRIAPLDLAASRDIGFDVLGSQQATPTAASFKAKREQDLLELSLQESMSKDLEWNQRRSGEFSRREAERGPLESAREPGDEKQVMVEKSVEVAPQTTFGELADTKNASVEASDREQNSTSFFAKGLSLAAMAGGAAVVAAAATALGRSNGRNSIAPESELPAVPVGTSEGIDEEFGEASPPLVEPVFADDFSFAKKSKKTKGKKGRRDTAGPEEESRLPTSAATSMPNPTLQTEEARAAADEAARERQRWEEQDTQDAVDTMLGITQPKKEKKGKKGKKTRSVEVEGPDPVPLEGSSELDQPRDLREELPAIDLADNEESLAGHRPRGLSKGMPATDVASVMVAVAAADAKLEDQDSSKKDPQADAPEDAWESFGAKTKKDKKKKKKASSFQPIEPFEEDVDVGERSVNAEPAETLIEGENLDELRVDHVDEQPLLSRTSSKKDKKKKKNGASFEPADTFDRVGDPDEGAINAEPADTVVTADIPEERQPDFADERPIISGKSSKKEKRKSKVLGQSLVATQDVGGDSTGSKPADVAYEEETPLETEPDFDAGKQTLSRKSSKKGKNAKKSRGNLEDLAEQDIGPVEPHLSSLVFAADAIPLPAGDDRDLEEPEDFSATAAQTVPPIDATMPNSNAISHARGPSDLSTADSQPERHEGGVPLTGLDVSDGPTQHEAISTRQIDPSPFAPEQVPEPTIERSVDDGFSISAPKKKKGKRGKQSPEEPALMGDPGLAEAERFGSEEPAYPTNPVSEEVSTFTPEQEYEPAVERSADDVFSITAPKKKKGKRGKQSQEEPAPRGDPGLAEAERFGSEEPEAQADPTNPVSEEATVEDEWAGFSTKKKDKKKKKQGRQRSLLERQVGSETALEEPAPVAVSDLNPEPSVEQSTLLPEAEAADHRVTGEGVIPHHLSERQEDISRDMPMEDAFATSLDQGLPIETSAPSTAVIENEAGENEPDTKWAEPAYQEKARKDKEAQSAALDPGLDRGLIDEPKDFTDPSVETNEALGDNPEAMDQAVAVPRPTFWSAFVGKKGKKGKNLSKGDSAEPATGVSTAFTGAGLDDAISPLIGMEVPGTEDHQSDALHAGANESAPTLSLDDEVFHHAESTPLPNESADELRELQTDLTNESNSYPIVPSGRALNIEGDRLTAAHGQDEDFVSGTDTNMGNEEASVDAFETAKVFAASEEMDPQPGFSITKSKKDKKKGKKSRASRALDESEIEQAVPVPISEEAGPRNLAPIDTAVIAATAAEGNPREISQPEAFDSQPEFEMSKVKTKKKGKKNAFVAWEDEGEAVPAATAAPLESSEILRGPRDAALVNEPEHMGNESRNDYSRDLQVEPSQPEPEYSMSKGKKKKGKKTNPPAWEDEKNLVSEANANDAEVIKESDPENLDLSREEGSLPTLQDDSGEMLTCNVSKKEKKKGKKAKGSAFDWNEPEQEVSDRQVQDLAAAASAYSTEDFQEPTVIPKDTAPLEDSWSGSKNKKDKKKKNRAPTIDWARALDAGEIKAEDPALGGDEAAVKAEETDDKVEFQRLMDPETMASVVSLEHRDSEAANASRDMLDEPGVLGATHASLIGHATDTKGTATVPADDDDFPSFFANKSKKDKKKSKKSRGVEVADDYDARPIEGTLTKDDSFGMDVPAISEEIFGRTDEPETRDIVPPGSETRSVSRQQERVETFEPSQTDDGEVDTSYARRNKDKKKAKPSQAAEFLETVEAESTPKDEVASDQSPAGAVDDAGRETDYLAEDTEVFAAEPEPLGRKASKKKSKRKQHLDFDEPSEMTPDPQDHSLQHPPENTAGGTPEGRDVQHYQNLDAPENFGPQAAEADPGLVMAEADLAPLGRKQSKKDKKKKKQFDRDESVEMEPEAQSRSIPDRDEQYPAVEAEDVRSRSVVDDTVDAPYHTSMETNAEGDLADPEPLALNRKQSKKDKKKKKQLDWDESVEMEPEAQSRPTLDRDAEYPVAEAEDVQSRSVVDTVDAPYHPSMEANIEGPDTEGDLAGPEPPALNRKQSKKDKKKKKQVDWEEPAEPTLETSELPSQDPAGLESEANALDQIEVVDRRQDENETYDAKKSKKDKKKSKKGQVLDFSEGADPVPQGIVSADDVGDVRDSTGPMEVAESPFEEFSSSKKAKKGKKSKNSQAFPWENEREKPENRSDEENPYVLGSDSRLRETSIERSRATSEERASQLTPRDSEQVSSEYHAEYEALAEPAGFADLAETRDASGSFEPGMMQDDTFEEYTERRLPYDIENRGQVRHREFESTPDLSPIEGGTAPSLRYDIESEAQQKDVAQEPQFEYTKHADQPMAFAENNFPELVDDDGLAEGNEEYSSKKKSKKSKKEHRRLADFDYDHEKVGLESSRAEPRLESSLPEENELEESRFREETGYLGSEQERNVQFPEPEEDASAFGSVKRKKSKRSKKERVAVWEDDTATQGPGREEGLSSRIEGGRFSSPMRESSRHGDSRSRARSRSRSISPNTDYNLPRERSLERRRSLSRGYVTNMELQRVVSPGDQREGSTHSFEESREELREAPVSRKKSKKGKNRRRDPGFEERDLSPTASPDLLPVEQPQFTDSNVADGFADPEEASKHPVRYPSTVLDEPEIRDEDLPKWETRDTREDRRITSLPSPPPEDSSTETKGMTSRGAAAVGVTAAGAGIAFFEGLQRSEPKVEEKKAKKKKKRDSKRSDWDDNDYGPQDSQPVEPNAIAAKSATTFPADPAELDLRDSAMYMESPQLPEQARFARSMRDSGYQGTEASPILPRGADGFGKESTTLEKGMSSTMGTSMTEASDHPLSISIEHNLDYDVSVSQEGERRYGDEYDDVRSRKKSHRQFEMPQEARYPSPEHDPDVPSPVHSTSKERSNTLLFSSSPSGREDAVFDHSRNRSIDDSSTPHERLAENFASSADNENEQVTSRSLFGGPLGINSDGNSLRSPPKTPNAPDSASRPLTTIKEHSPEDLHLHRRSNAIPDLGDPEQDAKGARRTNSTRSHRRAHSPLPADGHRRLGLLSTDDVISHLSWPEVDDEGEVVDLERNKSRSVANEKKESNRQKRKSYLGAADAKQHEQDRSISGESVRSHDSINAIIRSPQEVPHSATPPLRRKDRSVSSDLRAASRQSNSSGASAKKDKSAKTSKAGTARNLDLEDVEAVVASSSTYDPTTDKGKGRINKMADIYEGWGDVHGSPRSPTRPPSMRRRQSMQILDLETRLDQLVSENRLLKDAHSRVERGLDDAAHDHSQKNSALTEALHTRDLYLKQKDEELDSLKETLQALQDQVSHLNNVNTGLTAAAAVGGAGAIYAATRGGGDDYEQRYRDLEAEHMENARELEDLRGKHASLSGGMEGIVRQEVNLALQSKDAELEHVRNELEAAKQQIRKLQQQILASRNSDEILTSRDEDYFDSKCQQLCQNVQQWVLRFSKFSDMKVCRSINEIRNETISDRFDNAILDGSDVDIYLKDRIRRRDVFMSVVMRMVWEFVFTRYLFGMDREQRQKLKALEKTLSEVGPATAVNKWRATTLALLSKRNAFLQQRADDTEAVVEEIYSTLAELLTPPSNLVNQIKESLTKVMTMAVDLSVEMRTQRAEYIMLPPLEPEFDTNGDLARKVYFNSELMNERSGDTTSNEELANSQAVVRIVLFPLVVKRGDDDGLGEEEIVVCPAQVLIASEEERRGKKSVRVVSAQGNRSMNSVAPSQMEGGMI